MQSSGDFVKDFTLETPDEFVRPIYYDGTLVATVKWNDYDNDDHSRDLDDFRICDVRADGLAPYFVAENGGNTFEERIGGGHGNCETQGVGNISPKGATVSFKVDLSNSGASGPSRTNGLTYYFIE